MLFLRHGHASKHELGIDLLRPLSEEGKEKVANIKFPIEFEDVIMSPAVRTMQTGYMAIVKQQERIKMNKLRNIRFCPHLYAAILLPEMDAMYEAHGDHTMGYYKDPNIKNTMKIVAAASEDILRNKAENTLVVAHSVILNFVAHKIFGHKKLLEIDMETAKGFWVKDGKEIILF